MQATGRAETSSASRYISQLCKHWGHKYTVSFDRERGEIALPTGPCRLRAEPDALVVELEAADAETLERMEGVVAAHLQRFAFREPFTVEWSQASQPRRPTESK